MSRNTEQKWPFITNLSKMRSKCFAIIISIYNASLYFNSNLRNTEEAVMFISEDNMKI